MPIEAADIKLRLSTKAGAAGDSLASTPDDSLGKYMSTTDIVDATLENLFDNISGGEASAGDVEYRCFFAYNSHASLTLTDAATYIVSQVALGASVQIGVDPAGLTDHESAAAQAASIATESDAPAGVSFSAPTTFETGLALGDMDAGQCIAIWVKRTIAAATPALANDGATIAIQGTTGA